MEFQFEPIAAAIDYEQQIDHEELALIVDIGGGTADFTLIRLSPERRKKSERYDDILATSGVHIGGNDFDRRFNLATAMPLLGLHSHLQGPARLQIPSSHFYDLATWHLIHHQYERHTIHHVEELRRHAEQPEKIDRLLKVLKQQDGHRLISKIEECKIKLSLEQHAELDLSFIDTQLSLNCSRAEFNAATAQELAAIHNTIHQTLRASQTTIQQIDSVFLTGGTTALPAIQLTITALFPHSKIITGDRFGSVGTGLTLEAMRRFR